jgi:pimeloyl-ACP methyl ester carboxylesterase
MQKNTLYTQTMEAWPELQSFGERIRLTDLELNLFYYEAGEPNQPTLFMIHGLGDEADTWRHVLPRLSEQFHVVAVDLPGFGRSDKPAVKYTPDFMQAAIMTLLDALSIRNVTLMGSSLGAILSHSLALTYPERVNKLILVDGGLLQTNTMGDRSLSLMAIPLLGEWFYTHLRKDPQAAYESLRPVYRDLDALPQADRDFLFTRVNRRVWSNGQRRAYFSTLRKLAPWVVKAQKGLEDRLSNLQTPTLIIRGAEDGLFPVENAQAIAQAQPHATLATLPNTGHLPQQEDPETFLKIVLDWLSRHS